MKGCRSALTTPPSTPGMMGLIPACLKVESPSRSPTRRTPLLPCPTWKNTLPPNGQHRLFAIQIKMARPKEDRSPSPPLPCHLACLDFRFTVESSRFTVLLLLIPLPITGSLGCLSRLPALTKDHVSPGNPQVSRVRLGLLRHPQGRGTPRFAVSQVSQTCCC